MNYRIVTLKETRSLFGQRKFLALPRQVLPWPSGIQPGHLREPDHRRTIIPICRIVHVKWTRADSEVQKWMPAQRKRTKNSCRPQSQT